MKEIGFNKNRNKEKSIYENYIGKPGHYEAGSAGATGILHEINLDRGYMLIKPSIVGNPGNINTLNKDVPTVIKFGQGSSIVMRPLKEGDLEKYVEESIKEKEKKEKKEKQGEQK